MSWEQLNAMAKANGKHRAETILMLMVAAQGSDKNWNEQAIELKKFLNA